MRSRGISSISTSNNVNVEQELSFSFLKFGTVIFALVLALCLSREMLRVRRCLPQCLVREIYVHHWMQGGCFHCSSQFLQHTHCYGCVHYSTMCPDRNQICPNLHLQLYFYITGKDDLSSFWVKPLCQVHQHQRCGSSFTLHCTHSSTCERYFP